MANPGVASTQTGQTNQVLGVSNSTGVITGLQCQNELLPLIGIDRTITASDNAKLSDVGALITANSGAAIAVTIPNDSTVSWVADSALLVYQAGAGSISFAAGAGVTLNAGPSAPAAAQYVILGAIRVAANTWVTF